jgi:hypothetical protein
MGGGGVRDALLILLQVSGRSPAVPGQQRCAHHNLQADREEQPSVPLLHQDEEVGSN